MPVHLTLEHRLKGGREGGREGGRGGREGGREGREGGEGGRGGREGEGHLSTGKLPSKRMSHTNKHNAFFVKVIWPKQIVNL